MRYRFTQIPLDDHPARLYLKFEEADGAAHAMEIIWGNRLLTAGDWKYLGEPGASNRFPHFVARGGNTQTGRWHDERVDLKQLYEKHWGKGGEGTGNRSMDASRQVRLIEVALFCDTDATAAKSLAWFSKVRLEPRAVAGS